MAGRKPFGHGRGRNHNPGRCHAGSSRGGRFSGAEKVSATARARARAARIRAARAKATRSAKALAEAKTPRYRTDDAGNVVPDLRAAAAIIYDPATGNANLTFNQP